MLATLAQKMDLCTAPNQEEDYFDEPEEGYDEEVAEDDCYDHLHPELTATSKSSSLHNPSVASGFDLNPSKAVQHFSVHDLPPSGDFYYYHESCVLYENSSTLREYIINVKSGELRFLQYNGLETFRPLILSEAAKALLERLVVLFSSKTCKILNMNILRRCLGL